MAENKKYYWLKLHKDFFKRHEIRIIEDMPNGKDYILFYLKLLVESISHNGNLRFSDTIPYNEQMLATITNTNVDIVKSAMQIFLELNMIEVLDDATIYMLETENLIGSESDSAHRVREYRQRQSALQCNTNVTPALQECNTDIRDKSKENRDKSNKDIYCAVISYLNEKTGSKFKWQSKDTQKHINARVTEGYTLDDFKKVIDIKCAEWLGDARMCKYLRPSTLFGTKFEGYLNQRDTSSNGDYSY